MNNRENFINSVMPLLSMKILELMATNPGFINNLCSKYGVPISGDFSSCALLSKKMAEEIYSQTEAI